MKYKSLSHVLLLSTLSLSSYHMAYAGAKHNAMLPIKNTPAEVQRSFIDDLVVRSDLIFKGELIEKSEGLSIENIPYTFITYKVEEIIAGQYDNETITLKYVGGTFPNGNRLSATNSPEVTLGEQAILMVQKTIDTGCDFVECEHGRFVLDKGQIVAANESALVIDEKGGIDYISFAARIAGTHKASLDKPNLPLFISHLKNVDQATAAERKNARSVVLDIDKYEPFKAYPALTRAKSAPQVPKSVGKKFVRKVEGNDHDKWEEAMLKENGGNPILSQSYSNSKK